MGLIGNSIVRVDMAVNMGDVNLLTCIICLGEYQ
jgi:hypothetical protein